MTKTVILSTPHGPARCFETPTGNEPWALSMLTPVGTSPGGSWTTQDVLETVADFLKGPS